MADEHCLGNLHFEQKGWDVLARVSFCLALLIMPFYDRIHGIMHQYYQRSLQLAYFDDGKDRQVGELRENLLCPLFVYTATCNDFKRPGDKKVISEIAFTALHQGGEQTGYTRSPFFRSLVKVTALGSAATDAQVLGISDQLKYRFCLETFNLKMGDFILFHLEGRFCFKWAMRMVNRVWPDLLQRQKSYKFGIFERTISWLCVRTPSIALNMICFALMFKGYVVARSDPTSRSSEARLWFGAGVFLVACLYIMSFFGFAFQFLSVSTGIRQMHLVTRACQMSEGHPAMIYVTDGGVQDCTGLMQLMRRRCKCILLILGFDDPNCGLAQLRWAMDLAVEQGLGWFYDMDDPRRSYKMILDDFKKDSFDKTFFRLGIRYGWEMNPAEEDHAELIIIKNRLLPNYPRQIKAHLTEDEIMGWYGNPPPEGSTAYPRPERGWSNLEQHQLGGCCFDCCQKLGCNCGGKFPHNFTGFQCLTPQTFNSLCRLGYYMAADVTQRLKVHCSEDIAAGESAIGEKDVSKFYSMPMASDSSIAGN